MQTSTSITEIAKALVGFHKEVGKIAKDSSNPFFKSKYASLSNILEGIGDALNNNSLSVVQFPEGENCLTTRIIHTSGEWMESTYCMKPSKDDPQGRGSALTYQRRYALGAILSLNIDEDDDGNAASKNGKQVTAYNHKPVGNSLPVIPNEEFQKLVEESKAGNKSVIEAAKKKWAMDDTQLGLLRNVFNKPALTN